MSRAAALEYSQEYHQAAKEYAIVAERYSSTVYYRAAVRKAALLNIHPGNSESDPDKALHWLHTYLTLPLSPEEKEDARLYIDMLERMNALQVEISRQNADNDKLRRMTQEQSHNLAANAQRVNELEAELTQARIQLEEMKEVDLRMHSQRVNGDGNSPLELVEKAQELNPESYTLDPLAAEHPAPEVRNDSTAIRKSDRFPSNEDGRASDSGAENPAQKTDCGYPYTIQVGSFTELKDSILAASKSRENGELGFTSHAHIPHKGDWYRLFIGFYHTLDEAKKTARELKNREYTGAFVVKMPFAIQIEAPSTGEELKKIEADLQSRGYMAYSIPDKGKGDKNVLLVGAFSTKEETASPLKSLQEEGLKPSVVLR